MKEIFYYTGAIFWTTIFSLIIIIGYSFLPPFIRNFPADVWLITKLLFVGNKKAQWYYNGLSLSSDI